MWFLQRTRQYFCLMNFVFGFQGFLNIRTLLCFQWILDYNKHLWSIRTCTTNLTLSAIYFVQVKIHITWCQTAEKDQIKTAPIYCTKLNLKHVTSSTAKHQDQKHLPLLNLYGRLALVFLNCPWWSTWPSTASRAAAWHCALSPEQLVGKLFCLVEHNVSEGKKSPNNWDKMHRTSAE